MKWALIAHTHQQIVETLAGPDREALPGQGLVTRHNSLSVSSVAIIMSYNPLSVSQVTMMIEHMFLPLHHLGLVFRYNVLSCSY